MRSGRRSITALGVAAMRAAHQEVDGGRVFADPLAVRILGADARDPAFEASFDPARALPRMVIAARCRWAEDALGEAVERGVGQLVVLGAGLETVAYRSPDATLRLFELDLPATQAWKRERLAAAGIPEPPSLRFVPVDVERSSPAGELAKAGFDAGRPAFFLWVGVVPYLTTTAMWETLGFIGSLPHGSGVVFDYFEPADAMSPGQRAAHESRAAWAAENGEPFVGTVTPEDLAAGLRDLGFTRAWDLTYDAIIARHDRELGRQSEGAAAHVVHAVR